MILSKDLHYVYRGDIVTQLPTDSVLFLGETCVIAAFRRLHRYSICLEGKRLCFEDDDSAALNRVAVQCLGASQTRPQRASGPPNGRAHRLGRPYPEPPNILSRHPPPLRTLWTIPSDIIVSGNTQVSASPFPDPRKPFTPPLSG